jgi:SAM-dependent methyltransferase
LHLGRGVRTARQGASGTSAFDRDVDANAGYRYTTNAPLSSRLANERLTEATLELVSLTGRSLVDVGCGDGTYTAELRRRGAPARVVGIDPASRAIELAARFHPDVQFSVGDAGWLEQTPERFDVAVARGVLHHADDPARLVRAMARVAREVVVLEPNGLNPVLKGIERFSRYHREHGERSFRPRLVDRWLSEANLSVDARAYVGLVPFFCPAPAARVLKAVEPALESTRWLARSLLAVYAVHAIPRGS